jgi:branched-chain amino acid transport system permease protein
MTDTMTAPPAASVTPVVDQTRARSIGMPAGLGMIAVAVVGMALSFNGRLIIDPILSLGWLTLGMLPALAGWLAASRIELEGVESAPKGPMDVVTGAIAGAWAGAMFAAFVVVLAVWGDALRNELIQLSPQLLQMLTFDRGAIVGVVVVLVMSVAVGALFALLQILPVRLRAAMLSAVLWVVLAALLETVITGAFDSLKLGFVEDLLYTPDGALSLVGACIIAVLAAGLRYALHGQKATRAAKRPVGPPSTGMKLRMYGMLLAAAIVLPLIFDRSVNDMMINVVIFGIMALGLNIVIGLAGMLDLGNVAFFAVGAYVTALLTASESNGLAFAPELSFWVALPLAMLAAILLGIILGTPVIRLRGDYLAIVTLGFAAIAQVLVVSDWFAPVLGGPQGVRNVPAVPIPFFQDVNATVAPTGFLWLTLGFLALALYVAWRLQHSRTGRAWLAIREDETVAAAMGINVAVLKLTAYCVGATFASLAGGLFAAKVSSAFPTSFEILVSVIVLVIVIVGGTGYAPGVLLGSLVLVGVLGGPTTQGLLAEFAQYKLLLYGALLVVMMLLRPQGLMPKPDKSREIEQEEMDQDAWFDQNVGGSSEVSATSRSDDASDETEGEA